MRLIDAELLKEKFSASINTGYDTFDRDAICECIEFTPTAERNPWIPATERMPKCEEEVYIQTKKGTITTAMYEDGTIPGEESVWNWTDIDFDHDEESDINYVPKGWWEYRHFNPDDVYNNRVDEEVIAWMPLPEPYTESVEE